MGNSDRSTLVRTVLGAGVLLLGVAVYLVDRAANPVYFLQFLPVPLIASGSWTIFGSLGDHLPTFAHVYALIVLSSVVLARRRANAPWLCGGWSVLGGALEAMQHDAIAPAVAGAIPAWLAGVPFLEGGRAYLLNGTFDPLDLASIAVGALAAYSTLHLTRVAYRPLIQTEPKHSAAWRARRPAPTIALVAVALLTTVGTSDRDAYYLPGDGFVGTPGGAPSPGGPSTAVADRKPVVALAESQPALIVSRGRDNDDPQRPVNPFASTYDFTTRQLHSPLNLAALPGGSTAQTFITEFPTVVMDDSGNGAAVWSTINAAVPELHVNRFTRGAGWGQSFVLSSGTNVSAYRVAMDGFGRIVVAWLQGNDLLARGYLPTDGGPDGWLAVKTIRAGAVTELGDVVYAPTFAHVVWREGATAHTSQYDPFTNGWSLSSPIGTTKGTPARVQLALHRQLAQGANRPVAVWEGVDGIYFNRFLSGLGPQLIANSLSGRVPVVAMAKNEDALIAWEQGANVMVAPLTAGPGETLGVGEAPRIAMDAAGNAIVVWRAGTIVRASGYVQGMGWQGPSDIGEALVSQGQPELAMDDGGRAIAVWEATMPSTLNTKLETYVFGTPFARFTATPSPVLAGSPLTLDASASTDLDGTIVSYEWDFNDDGVIDALGITTQVTYPSPGNRTVRLVVTDDDGRSSAATQVVTVGGAQGQLTVVVVGAGGHVTSNPSAIACSTVATGTPSCTGTFPTGFPVTLTAAADPGWVFQQWSGDPDCSDDNSGAVAVVTLDQGKSCTATFIPDIVLVSLSVAVVGDGGTVQGGTPEQPGTIACSSVAPGGDCQEAYPSGATVTLTVAPSAGATFSGWGAACSAFGAATPIDLVMDGNKSCTATFAPIGGPASARLLVSVKGLGAVTSADFGIATCRADGSGDCDEIYSPGANVTLLATADPGQQFLGWELDCTALDPLSAAVLMTADRECRAVFSAGGGFTLQLGDGRLTTAVGGAQQRTSITITRTGHNGAVDLTVDGCPASVVCLLDPGNLSAGESSSELLLLPNPGVAGLHTITVRGSGGGEERTDIVELELVDTTEILSLVVGGSGLGVIEYDPPVAACVKNAPPTECDRPFIVNTTVTLRPLLSPGSIFGGWTGCDSVNGNQCTVTMTEFKALQAVINGL